MFVSGRPLQQLKDHRHYVQGVTWDPLGQYLASQSSDRSLCIYSVVDKEEKKKKAVAGEKALGAAAASTATPEEATTTTRRIKEIKPVVTHTRFDFAEYAKLRSVTTDSSDPTTRTVTLADSDSPTTVKVTIAAEQVEETPAVTAVSEETAVPMDTSVARSAAKTDANPAASSSNKTRFFHDETLPSFFRRLGFTPDGALLLAPGGLGSALLHPEVASRTAPKPAANADAAPAPVGQEAGATKSEESDGVKKPTEETTTAPRATAIHTLYAFARSYLNAPLFDICALSKPAIAVRCSPALFQHRQLAEPVAPFLKLPYRMIFAIATIDTVLVYDTQQRAPFAMFTNLHYAPLTDIAWSGDGHTLMMSSQDGYCSYVTWKEGEIGLPLAASAYPEGVPAPALLAELPTLDDKTLVAPAPVAVTQPMLSASSSTTATSVNDISHLIKKKTPTGVVAAATPAAPLVNDLSHLIKRKATTAAALTASASASTEANGSAVAFLSPFKRKDEAESSENGHESDPELNKRLKLDAENVDAM
ncbi:chromatin assembly factor 1, variant 2 [Capsaspora owczarzaki ATCC 30864]|uniref:Chromatin assembly factor 1, variant 2 n=1 Tax=Capsaspora owczarzaki (strain ATCC 30864) TaxID=595528 RepID=A0A0D2UKS6_CAPO3|nr:chromatin assembly factor 1, variant 2 [Capsaspora owczarzaki ATCC 30864]